MPEFREINNAPLANFEPPTFDLRNKVKKVFRKGYPDGGPFDALVLAIDNKLQRSGRRYPRETQLDTIVGVIEGMLSRGYTNDKFVTGVELMRTNEGNAVFEELVTRRPSVESSPSTDVGNTAQHAPPAAGQTLSPGTTSDRGVSPNTLVSSVEVVAVQDQTQHDTTNLGSPSRFINQNYHDIVPTNIDAPADVLWAVAVHDRDIEASGGLMLEDRRRSIGSFGYRFRSIVLFEVLTAIIVFLCLLSIVIYLASSNHLLALDIFRRP